MSRIDVSNLCFGYDGSYDNIFEQVSFAIDTDWKLGFIGRNGKGKTTFLNLLLGKYEYQGSITASVRFDYFPYKVKEEQKELNTIEVIEALQPEYELWKICRELEALATDAELLYRPYATLSFGEQTKVLLALLFSVDTSFMLIDEPTNHLDAQTREIVKTYLNSKKGYILVSHDRNLLDACIDHVLVLNRNSIEVNKGNFTTWWENKQKQDAYELSENERLKKDIVHLKEAARRSAEWADRSEGTKIGFNPTKEHDRSISTRSYIGAKTKKIQNRVHTYEARQARALAEKESLLKNLENPPELRITPLEHYKEEYIRFFDVNIGYDTHEILHHFSLTIRKGERVVLRGENGCGKSSLIKSILNSNQSLSSSLYINGDAWVAKGLVISYINQDTSYLNGSLNDFISQTGAEESLFKAILRQLDFDRVQFDKQIEEYSEGQKKKLLIVSSLLKPAHLYIWDEPLNYIDVFTRMQIEALILKYKPTMLIVEHDVMFSERVATKIVEM